MTYHPPKTRKISQFRSEFHLIFHLKFNFPLHPLRSKKPTKIPKKSLPCHFHRFSTAFPLPNHSTFKCSKSKLIFSRDRVITFLFVFFIFCAKKRATRKKLHINNSTFFLFAVTQAQSHMYVHITKKKLTAGFLPRKSRLRPQCHPRESLTSFFPFN